MKSLHPETLMDTRTYEVLPIGNLDFDNIQELKDLSFDMRSVRFEYDQTNGLFRVSAKFKNKSRIVVFRIGNKGLISAMQFDCIKRQVMDRAS